MSSQVAHGFQNPDVLLEEVGSRKISSMGKKTNETTAINIDGENVDSSENSDILTSQNEIYLVSNESPNPRTLNQKNLIRSFAA